MDLKLVQPRVEEILKGKGFRLVSMRFLSEEGEQYLRVIVDKYHYDIGLDEIVDISESIDQLIDEIDSDGNFILDVTTSGAEKEIGLDEVGNYLDRYINITFIDGVKGPPHIEGTLKAVDHDKLLISVNEKGRIKQIEVLINTIKKIRRAIKI